MIFDELRCERSFTRCFECDCVVDSREDARWVSATRDGKPVRYLACTECAAGADPSCVEGVEPNPLIDEVIACDEKIMEAKNVITAQTRKKYETIFRILDEEGYEPGLVFYAIGGNKMVVTGRSRGIREGGNVEVIVHPAKKDGTPSKYNEDRIPWVDFVRLWRMQRPDPELYARRTAERFRRKNEEFNSKALGDDLKF